jgi:hypothetical protein
MKASAVIVDTINPKITAIKPRRAFQFLCIVTIFFDWKLNVDYSFSALKNGKRP